MKPLPHQQKIISKKKNKLGLFFDTGAGKTYTSLWSLKELKREYVLIVCPKIVHSKWIEDITTLFGSLYETSVIQEGRASRVYTEGTQYFVMTKEYFRDKWIPEWEIDGVIFDEAHFVASPSSKMTKKLYGFVSRFSEEALSVYLLTATPYLSTPWNVYTLGRLLGKEWGYKSFEKEMFYQIDIGSRYIQKPKPDAPQRLMPYLKQTGVFVRIEDVVEDLPPQKINIVGLEQTKEQKNAIENESTVEALARITKLHQIENGYISASVLEARSIKDLPHTKLKWIVDYTDKNNYCAIICRYKHQMYTYQKELESRGHKVYVLNGETKNRDKLLEDVRKTNKGIIIIQAMVSEGYELPEIEHVVFASMDWSYKNYIQMMGRFLRVNKPTPTQYHILCSGKIDNRVYDSMQLKRDFYPE
jgi:superfamily II DNA or RNA helicase